LKRLQIVNSELQQIFFSISQFDTSPQPPDESSGWGHPDCVVLQDWRRVNRKYKDPL
jgi:hypothetical protein